MPSSSLADETKELLDQSKSRVMYVDDSHVVRATELPRSASCCKRGDNFCKDLFMGWCPLIAAVVIVYAMYYVIVYGL